MKFLTTLYFTQKLSEKNKIIKMKTKIKNRELLVFVLSNNFLLILDLLFGSGSSQIGF